MLLIYIHCRHHSLHNTGRQMCSAFFGLCVHTRLCCLMEQMTTVGGGGALQTDLGWLILYVAIWSKSTRLFSVLSPCFLQQTASAMPCKQATPATRQQSLCRAAARSASSVSLLLRRSSVGLSSNFKRAELQMTIWMSSDSLQTPRRPFILHVLF